MRKFNFYIVVLLSLMVNFPCLGNNYYLQYFSTEQGLSTNEVVKIIQDSKGFMWFATRGGLNRYDGYDFIQFTASANDQYNLSNPSIECIFEDSNKNLWIGTKSGGLNFFEYSIEQFSQIQHYGAENQPLRDNRVVSINETTDGRMLIGTWSDGLYVLDPLNEKIHYLFKNTRIHSILMFGENLAWLGTNRGLFQMNLDNYEFEHIVFDRTFEVTNLILDSDDEHIWIAGWEAGLTRLNTKTNAYERYSLNASDTEFTSSQNSTYSLLLDKNDRLWVGTWNGGLYTFNKDDKTFDKFEIKSANRGKLNSDFDVILDIFEDRDNNIWIATDAGGLVFIGKKNSFQSVSYSNNPGCGLKSFYTTTIYETKDKTLWIGTRGGGLYKSNNKNEFEHIPTENETFESQIVKCIYPISDNILFICSGQDLYYLDLSKENIVKLVEDETISGIKKIITILRIEQDILIGTQQNGMYFIEDYFNGGKELIHFTPGTNAVLKNDRITFLKKDLNNNVWVGTYKGVYLFDTHKKSLSNVVVNDGDVLNNIIIYCWEQINDSSIWLGTSKGLVKINESDDENYFVEYFNRKNYFPYDYVRRILSDKQNNIWLSTNAGLVRMNSTDNTFSSFDKTDGLLELNHTETVSFKNQEGILYFGGVNGFNYFNPEKVQTDNTVPSLVFTRLNVYNQEVKPMSGGKENVILPKTISWNPTIKLSHKEKEFTLEFAALNYNASKRNNYRYKLEGYDDDWILAGTKRSATYNNLNGGDYKFMVKGSNNNNVWNEEPIVLKIHIKSAPWKTWYAILFYIAFIIGLVYLIVRNAKRQAELANKLELETVKSEQEHQLNEMKLRFFTNVSHEFRTPLTMILGRVKEVLNDNAENRKLKVVYRNAQRLLELVNQLLEFRRVESDTVSLKVSENNIADFVKEICISFKEMAKVNDIKFERKINVHTKLLWFDIEKLEIILNNIVYNAFKYAGTGSVVRLKVSESDKYIGFHVIDNGPGIEEADIGKIFNRFYQSKEKCNFGSSGIGLNLTKRMVELHSGEITVESIPNEKTEFIVKLLKGNNHFLDEDKLDFQIMKSPVPLVKGNARKLRTKLVSPEPLQKETSVLVVEDNFEVREFLYDLFADDYNVEVATNGKEGYNFALEKSFDLIISDVIMPEMDGMELCKKLKANPNTSHIPVVLLTAKSAGQFRLEGLTYGADAYISKPFDPVELKVRVSSILFSHKKLKDKYSKVISLEPTELEITSGDEKFVEKLIGVVEQNIDNSDFSSEDLAKSMGMSGPTLYRKLKSVVGQSSNEFIRSIRLKRAAQLLADPNNTVSEIVYMVGFSDAKYFRKCFRKQFDTTPTEFRNRQND